MAAVEAQCLAQLRQTGIALPANNAELARKFAEENGVPIIGEEPKVVAPASVADLLKEIEEKPLEGSLANVSESDIEEMLKDGCPND